MKVMIAYATKSGAAGECAELLRQRLADCEVFDLNKVTPDPAGYDVVIIGSGVRMGKVYKPVKTFIRNHLQQLCDKRTAVYLCNAYGDTFDKSVAKNIPEPLQKAAVSVISFGGKPPFTKTEGTTWRKDEAIMELIGVVGI